MRKLIFILFCFMTLQSNAQGGIMIEAGGPAGYFSVNYVAESLNVGPRSSVEARIGYGTYRITGVNGKFTPDIIVPIGFAFRNTGISRFSFGAGITVSGIQRYVGNDLKRDWSLAGFESVSFRFLNKEHFVANATAYLLNEPQKPFRPWGGLSFTYLF